MEFKLWLFAIILGRLCSCVVTASTDTPICKEGLQNDTKECCPASVNMSVNTFNMSVNTSCPDNYQLVNKSGVVCEQNIDNTTTTVSPLTTTVTTTVTDEPADNTTGNDIKDMDSGEDEIDVVPDVEVCERCGIHDHFNNITRDCEKCGEACLSCYREDRDNCTVCLIEHDGKCLSKCPSGTVLSDRNTDNGSKLCDEEKGLPIVIIAGAAGGGAALIIIIIVVIICCCLCRRRQGRRDVDGKTRTAMSMIIDQNNANESTIPETGDKPRKQRRNYENMNAKLPGQEEIANQADGLGRYIRDPTTRPKTKQGRTKEPDRSSDADTYANNAMVKLARTTDLTSVDSSKLEAMVEKEELKELGQAPIAPAIPVPTSAKPSKTGLVKKFSQRVTKLKNRKSKSKMQDKQVSAPSGVENGLEDYENVKFSDVKQGRKAQPQPTIDTQTTQEDEMEVYENVNSSTAGNTNPSTAANGSLDDLEDYENTKGLRKTETMIDETAGSAAEAGGDLEDYANLQGLEHYENFDFKQVKGRKAKN